MIRINLSCDVCGQTLKTGQIHESMDGSNILFVKPCELGCKRVNAPTRKSSNSEEENLLDKSNLDYLITLAEVIGDDDGRNPQDLLNDIKESLDIRLQHQLSRDV